MYRADYLLALEPITAIKVANGGTFGPIARIPRHAKLRIAGNSTLDGMVEVEWQGERYAAFLADVNARCRSSASDAPADRRFPSL